MLRATKAESEELRFALSCWIGIDAADVLIESCREKYGFYAAGQGALKIWREAHLAIRFARKVGATELKMQDAPDVILMIDGQQVQVELTVARSIEALKGEDWAGFAELENSGKIIASELYDPAPQCRAVGLQVRKAIKNKVSKPYSYSSVLAVSASCMWLTEFESEMMLEIENAIFEHQSNFAEIWVLAGGRFFRSTNCVRDYRWWDSNPHGPLSPTDFKSVASAISPHRLRADASYADKARDQVFCVLVNGTESVRQDSSRTYRRIMMRRFVGCPCG